MKKYDAQARQGDMDPEFIKAWGRTLKAVVEATEPAQEKRQALIRMIRQAFQQLGQISPV